MISSGTRAGVSALVVGVCGILFASLAPGGQAAENLNLQSVESAISVSATIQIVSPSRTFQLALNRERFEKFLREDGPDFVLSIERSSRAKRLATWLSSLDLREVAPATHANLRYKIEFFDGEKSLVTLYAGTSGRIIKGESLMEARKRTPILLSLWEDTRRDFIW